MRSCHGCKHESALITANKGDGGEGGVLGSWKPNPTKRAGGEGGFCEGEGNLGLPAFTGAEANIMHSTPFPLKQVLILI